MCVCSTLKDLSRCCGKCYSAAAHPLAPRPPRLDPPPPSRDTCARAVARHCARCPAGRDAWYAYAVTIALGVTFCLALVGVVVHRLTSAYKRLKGKRRSDASGIARVFFNWVQMVSMLQSIKLQPPEEVTDAMESAEVVNVSIEWFPVQCTLRLTFFARVVIYMVLPLAAVLIPLSFVYCLSCTTPLLRKITASRRSAERVGKRLGLCHRFIYAFVALISGDDMVKRAAAKRERGRATATADENDVDALNVEIDTLLNELLNAEAELAEAELRSGGTYVEGGHAGRNEACGAPPRAASAPMFDTLEAIDEEIETECRAVDEGATSTVGATDARSAQPLHAAERGARAVEATRQRTHGSASSGGASARASVRHSPFSQFAFFRVVSELPIAVRQAPAHDAMKLPWVVWPGDVVATEAIEVGPGGVRFLKLSGDWGEGWIFDRATVEGVELLAEVDSPEMVCTAAAIVESHYRDEVAHCFEAIRKSSALAAGRAEGVAAHCIAREALENVLPSRMNRARQDAFFGAFADHDGAEGSVGFAAFVAMYPALRATWRYEGVWAEFQYLDTSKCGMLREQELERCVPLHVYARTRARLFLSLSLSLFSLTHSHSLSLSVFSSFPSIAFTHSRRPTRSRTALHPALFRKAPPTQSSPSGCTASIAAAKDTFHSVTLSPSTSPSSGIR